MAAPLASMTGFSRAEGTESGAAWSWELRSVNGRGLDLRFRLPPGYETLEPALREAAGKLLRRGNVTANLAVRRPEAPQIVVDAVLLDRVLALAAELSARIPGAAPPRAEALLALPGVLKQGAATDADAAPRGTDGDVLRGFGAALEALTAARRSEGARLADTLATLLREIAALRDRAASEAADQPAAQRARMMESLQALLGETPSLPEERVAQEVALLAAKSDVREELDRLAAHIAAAHALLAEGANIGRRFEFLVQEFNREANTLCSKSASIALTATGLQLKATIEQLREQVQNVE